jgi:hypothetical protein
MKQFFSVLFLFALFSGLVLAQDAVQDLAPKSSEPAVIAGHGGSPIWEAPAATLFDNGPIVNDPGGGAGGADRSFIESALGHTLYGWGHQIVNNNTMADDFTIPAGENWQIDQVITYAYQTGSTTTSTINDARIQIWNGNPMSGGTVIWGDLTTNRYASSTWGNIYRTTDTDPTNTQRPVMLVTSNIGTTLTEGTYWIQWQLGGTLASGPWCPPVTILGQAVTGDALQGLAGVFSPALNGTSPNGAPFILIGTSGGGGGNTYFEDFEGFIAAQQLACQDPTNWTTWSNAPCGNEDALVSTNYAFSGTKSVLIDWVSPRYVDLVKPLGGQTAGTWYVDFMAYIPTGKYGYYNILADFAGASSQWAFQAYFNAGGTGTIDAGGASAATFTFPHNTWFAVQFKVDLDADLAQFWVNGVSIYTWQYTLGTFGTPVPKVLDASDIFAPNATPANNEMYIDDFRFSDTPVPVELTSFAANVNNLGQVVLNWETASELNNLGFEIERRTETSEFRTVGFVEGNGTTTQQNSYSYIDKAAEQGINYYRLKQVDFNGTYDYSDVVEVEVVGPLTFELAQNYPNPFNPSTKIKYSVPESGNIRLSVYNLVGEEVAVLVNGFSQAGFFEVTFDASNLSTGVYLYKLQSANSVQTKKMMLLK